MTGIGTSRDYVVAGLAFVPAFAITVSTPNPQSSCRSIRGPTSLVVEDVES